MEQLSKTEFKAHALEVLKVVEQSGQSKIITNHGKPTLEIRKLRNRLESPLEILKGTVVKYENPMDPIDVDDWKNA